MQKDGIKKIKWALSAGIFITVVTTGVIFFAIRSQNNVPTLIINQTQLQVDIADTNTKRQKGLCCRDYLDSNSGMLFVYDQPGDYRFWMKDTHIPLDMYWISEEKKIVHIEKNVQPSSYPNSFGSEKPAQYILETNAGFAEQNNIKLDDQVSF